ncbi:hypothetical protein NDU88_010694 [Pleurodeles waltl]|uniref:Uncharacterized protein n=1 Tax=Pleurodeles waltl TaxID=8319 RepID=A0AAV7R1A6_PLEWA|nr:hypothetical protein NDU88_010694 [Pleurodeles waltl]
MMVYFNGPGQTIMELPAAHDELCVIQKQATQSTNQRAGAYDVKRLWNRTAASRLTRKGRSPFRSARRVCLWAV